MEVGEFFAKAIQHSGKVCKPVTNDKVRTLIIIITTIIITTIIIIIITIITIVYYRQPTMTHLVLTPTSFFPISVLPTTTR